MAANDTCESFQQRLTDALDACGARGELVHFWWRDDDAVHDGPRLRRLFRLVAGEALALAVIPQPAEIDLVAALDDAPGVTVFQHGWANVNHAPRGRSLGAWELDGFRPAEQVLDEMGTGKRRLEQLFGTRFHPIMVLPWNRVDRALLPGLAAQGFLGVSGTGEGVGSEPLPGLRCIDCQIDVLRWKQGARFAGWKKSADALVAALSEFAATSVICVNTHHAVTDDGGWAFIETLSRLLAEHPAARWAQPRQLFA